ncbi:peptide chain release factor N(5)-glutamine methyltransferase [Verrucomicrobiales bacterium]|jgi:release factor glutamine methyltransferase|nr:peptide chain release factor N(5)-glutamine methyltransferase [bacterium]MDB4712103.1 peptide chain release factor N(5)-glutamine methyltransferase [Verrucomicrobiales bacterium]MDB4721671.1 peptide chain release factor N(5)-glutamine methyltransferase [Verrucomicrobiales bacterium]MDC0048948.1 peptide chain release factor N(5)-glutamine methyltransferase [Verrucomicrobiota bacterium]NCG27632.1 peptide chain release factor N(5)-glutamine methyltransferase [Verrucomicrobiales bacterium]|tara:strand:+ start:434 stop:1279 length:846 start_codon:yes stop_codon:yes gene_type:complete
MKSLLETLQSGSGYLEDRGIDDARLNMEHIIAKVLGCERIELYLSFDRPMQDKELEELRSLLKRRGKREPLQHILGTVEFMGQEFICDSRALIPRPETEELVGILLNRFSPSSEPSRILDAGCGSGVIGISLALKWKDSHLTMIDCSEDALSLSKENAINSELSDSRISYVCCDLLNDVTGPFDIIAANLPYVDPNEIDGLETELSFEPRNALDGGEGGTELISRFISQIPDKLSEQGLLTLEVGEGQTDFFEGAISKIGFGQIETLKDLSGIERFILAMR